MQALTRFVTFFLVALSCSAATTCYARTESPNGSGDDRVIAKVNSQPIYFSQVKPAIDVVQGRFKKYGAGGLAEETRNRIQSEELERQIAMELLYQAGDKLFAQEIDKKVDEMLSQQSQGKVTPTANPDNEANRSKLRRQLVIDQFVLMRGGRDVTVPEVELRKYYEQNAASFKESESVRVAHILIKLSPKASPEEVTRSKSTVEALRTEILAGKDFGEIARQHSTCSSATAGGDLGYIKRNFMPQEFDAAAFALKEGALSDIVRTRHGFHLIKAFDRKSERIPQFSEMKDFIEKYLGKEVQKKKIDEIVKELRREAKVELFI